MRIIVLILFLSHLSIFATYGQSASDKESFQLKGTLGGKYSITMSLTTDWFTVNGDYYYYSNSDNRLELTGEVLGDNFILKERDNKGNITGNFTINYNDFTGTWSSNNRTLSVELHDINSYTKSKPKRDTVYLTDQGIILDGLDKALEFSDYSTDDYKDMIIELPEGISSPKNSKDYKKIYTEELDSQNRSSNWRINGEIADGEFLWYTQQEYKNFKNYQYLLVKFKDGILLPISIGYWEDDDGTLIISGIEKDIYDENGDYLHTIFNDFYGNNVVGKIEYYYLQNYRIASGNIFHWRVSSIPPNPHLICHIEEYDNQGDRTSIWRFYQSNSNTARDRLDWFRAEESLPKSNWETYFEYGYPQSNTDDGQERLINIYRPEGVSSELYMENHYLCDFGSENPNKPIKLVQRKLFTSSMLNAHEQDELYNYRNIDSLNYQYIRENGKPKYLLVNTFNGSTKLSTEHYSLIDSHDISINLFDISGNHFRTARYSAKNQDFTYHDIPFTTGNLSITAVSGNKLQALLDTESFDEELIITDLSYELTEDALILDHPKGEVRINSETYYYDDQSESTASYLGYSNRLKGFFVLKYSNVYLIPQSEIVALPFAYDVTINSQSGLIISGIMESSGVRVNRVDNNGSYVLGYLYNISVESLKWVSPTEALIKDYNSDQYYILCVGDSEEATPLEFSESYDIDIINIETMY